MFDFVRETRGKRHVKQQQDDGPVLMVDEDGNLTDDDGPVLDEDGLHLLLENGKINLAASIVNATHSNN